MLVIIQARSNSRRFRNKVLFPIYGIPIIQYVVTRAKASKNVKKVIVSSSINKSDDKLIRYLKDKKINFYRGNLQNVALRLYKTAQKNKSKFFIRINGDSPLIDTHLIDKAIKIHNNAKKKFDLITNVFPRSYPKGQSVEIIKVSLFKKHIKKFSALEKEHVTMYFYKNFKNFNIKNFAFKGNKKIMNLSIDTKIDLKRILKNFTKKTFKTFSFSK
ncbi:cytidylyltransferase domain-containing protein [Candidatus Pelagibacter sp. Uisw_134_02]|uniref:cytidylyltransferase domain-containing protein n=1 Tax=Candidatus Pelagibacter sp. Uisw_134_02 TaxID=3230990 RepID=UPI0039E7F276